MSEISHLSSVRLDYRLDGGVAARVEDLTPRDGEDLRRRHLEQQLALRGCQGAQQRESVSVSGGDRSERGESG